LFVRIILLVPKWQRGFRTLFIETNMKLITSKVDARITSGFPDDLPKFCRETIEHLKKWLLK
jgi:hypothetical protein